MPIKIRKERPLYEIVYTDGNGDKATFGCVILTTSEVAKMADEATVVSWDAPKKRQAKQRFERMDVSKFHRLKLERIIKSWDLLDPDGNVLPCTIENKLIVEEVNPEIIEFVFGEVDRIAESLEQEEQGELGNSEASQNGSPEEI